MGFPAHSVVQTGYTTPTLRFRGYITRANRRTANTVYTLLFDI